MVVSLLAITLAAHLKMDFNNVDRHCWLIEGRDRFRLPLEVGNSEWEYSQGDLLGWPLNKDRMLKRVAEANNWELTNLALFENGVEIQRLRFDNLGMRWLADDDKWGGHKKANDLRYLASRTWLGQIVFAPQVHPKYAIGVLCVQNLSESAQPILTQALVRIDFVPNLTVQFIRDIGYLRDTVRFTSPNIPRVFRLGTRLWVVAEEGIEPLDQAGQPGAARYKPSTGQCPVGSVGDDTIILSDSPRNKLVLWHPDRQTQQFPLPEEFHEDGRFDESNQLPLFSIGSRVIDAHSGKSRVFFNNLIMWKRYAIQWDGSIATIYDATSGKYLTSLKRSARLPA